MGKEELPYHSIPDDLLRQSVGESYNIYQATVAMCSIFLGFVFSGLIQMLGGEDDLTDEMRWVVRVLVVALLLLLGSLIGFHMTANQTVRYWKIFFPRSRARNVASVMFQLGMIAMLMVVALLLLSKGERVAGWLVAATAACLFPLTFRVGGLHARAPYVRRVD